MEDTNIVNKNPSELSDIGLSNNAQIIIGELNSMHGKAKEKITELIHTLQDIDKLNNKQIKKVLLTEVHFISRTTLYDAMPKELKRDYTKKSEHVINPNTGMQDQPLPRDHPVYKEPDRVESPSQPEPETKPVYQPKQEPSQPKQQEQQAPTKPIPDFKVIKYGTVTEAFKQITFSLGQVMDKKRPCKMGLLIFYT